MDNRTRQTRLPPQTRYNDATQLVADLKSQLRDGQRFISRQFIRSKINRASTQQEKAEEAVVKELSSSPAKFAEKLSGLITDAKAIVDSIATEGASNKELLPMIDKVTTGIIQMDRACAIAGDRMVNDIAADLASRARWQRPEVIARSATPAMSAMMKAGVTVSYAFYPFLEAREFAFRQEPHESQETSIPKNMLVAMNGNAPGPARLLALAKEGLESLQAADRQLSG